MRYKVGDEVVLNGHAVVLGRINAVEIIGKEGEGEYEAYITDASNQRMVFNDNHINHEKTAELQKKDKTLNHYQGELEKIVEQRNNDDYTKALMKYGRVEGDGLDNVNHPPHYTQGDIETLDIIKILTVGYEGYEGSLVGNIVKYIARANFKGNKLEDIKKGQFYYNKLVEELEEDGD